MDATALPGSAYALFLKRLTLIPPYRKGARRLRAEARSAGALGSSLPEPVSLIEEGI